MTDRPFMDYAVPPMSSLKRTNQHSPTVTSLCCGVGGSILGYRYAGYRIVEAMDIDPTMVEQFNANHGAHACAVDLAAKDIGDLVVSEVDVVDMSPPDVTGENFDVLMGAVRTAVRIRPKAIVITVLPSLHQGRSVGYFLDATEALGEHYDFRAIRLDAEWLGVPQRRKRTTIVAIRRDLDAATRYTLPQPYHFRHTLRDALQGLETPPDDHPCWLGDTAVGREWRNLAPGQWSKRYFNLVRTSWDEPCPTITKSGGTRSTAAPCHPDEPRKFTIDELKRICSFPDDFHLSGSFAHQYRALGQAVPPLMAYHVALTVKHALQWDESTSNRRAGARSRSGAKAKVTEV